MMTRGAARSEIRFINPEDLSEERRHEIADVLGFEIDEYEDQRRILGMKEK
jgi:hypothetical protein